MLTLTETMVELSDCHTTLYYLKEQPPQTAPLPLGTAVGYNGLYQTIAAPVRVTYDTVSGHAGLILEKFSPVYRENKYWKRVFATDQVAAYPYRAWEFILPIVCSLRMRIEFIPDSQFKFRVRPIPCVLLYPFGWSTWISLRLTGEHTLGDLAEFNQHILTAKAFRLDPDGDQQQLTGLSVHDLFEHVAAGVRIDAFGALMTNDFSPSEAVVVTTVLAKWGGTLGGLGNNEKQQVLRIVTPEGPPPQGAFEQYIHQLEPKSSPKYVVMNGYGRFTWMEDRLEPVDRNYPHLRCYHNNTFNSLVQARHLYQLLTQAARLKSLSGPLSELTDNANVYLSSASDYYENASLREFLASPAVAGAQKNMQKFDSKPASSS